MTTFSNAFPITSTFHGTLNHDAAVRKAIREFEDNYGALRLVGSENIIDLGSGRFIVMFFFAEPGEDQPSKMLFGFFRASKAHDEIFEFRFAPVFSPLFLDEMFKFIFFSNSR
jgi:hypothetical protein